MTSSYDCLCCGAKNLESYSCKYVLDKKNGITSKDYLCHPCSKNELWKEYILDKKLNTSIILNAIVRSYRPDRTRVEKEVSDATELINKEIKYFEDNIWFNGLRDTVLNNSSKGMSFENKNLFSKIFFKSKNFQILTYCLAGRCMITLRKGDDYVSLLTDDNINNQERCMGLQGCSGSLEDILSLFFYSYDLYNKSKMKFKSDKKISII